MRKILELNNGKLKAMVYRLSATNEYKVTFYINDIKIKDGDSFTDSKEDAIGTANYFVKNGK